MSLSSSLLAPVLSLSPFHVILLLTGLYVLLKRVKGKKDYTTKLPSESLTVENTVIAFDLHEVVMHPLVGEMIQMALFTAEGWKLALTLLRPDILLFTLYVFLKSFFLNLFFSKGMVVEELFFILADKYDVVMQQKAFFMKLSNHFEKDPETWKVIEALKKKGYQVYILSNIGSKFFDEMKVRLMTPFYEDNFVGRLCSSEDDGYLKKPVPKYYDLFVERFNAEGKRIVFIDDKVSNLVANETCRNAELFVNVHFTKGSKLRRDFKQWGLI